MCSTVSHSSLPGPDYYIPPHETWVIEILKMTSVVKFIFLPAFWAVATEEWDLKPELLRSTVWATLSHTLIEGLQQREKEQSAINPGLQLKDRFLISVMYLCRRAHAMPL